MSKLAELLQSRKAVAANPANSANPADAPGIESAEISRISKISRGGTPETIFQPAALARPMARRGNALPADLERRIRTMALRWQYTYEDLSDALLRASRDPDGWARAVALDERREQEFRACGILPKADA